MANLSFTMLIVCTAAVLALVLGAVGLTVRASVDELLYNDERNEVVFVKYL